MVDQKEGSLGLQSFLNKQRWFPVGFSTVLCLVPSTQQAEEYKGIGPHIFFTYEVPLCSKTRGGLGWVWLGFGFFSARWFLTLRAPNALQMAGQVLQTRCYWGVTGRVRKAIYDMSPLEANMEK